MTIHDKINMRQNLFYYMPTNQAMQLYERNLIALAPYYSGRLIRQRKEVAAAEQFKSIYGKTRYQYENNI